MIDTADSSLDFTVSPSLWSIIMNQTTEQEINR